MSSGDTRDIGGSGAWGAFLRQGGIQALMVAILSISAIYIMLKFLALAPLQEYMRDKLVHSADLALDSLQNAALRHEISEAPAPVEIGPEQKRIEPIHVTRDGTQNPRIAQLSALIETQVPAVGTSSRDFWLGAIFAPVDGPLHARWLLRERPLLDGSTGFVLVNAYEEWALMQRFWNIFLTAALSGFGAIFAAAWWVFSRNYRSELWLANFLDTWKAENVPLPRPEAPLSPAMTRIFRKSAETLRRIAAAQQTRETLWADFLHDVLGTVHVLTYSTYSIRGDREQGRIDATSALDAVMRELDGAMVEFVNARKLHSLVMKEDDRRVYIDMAQTLKGLVSGIGSTQREAKEIRLKTPLAKGLTVEIVRAFLEKILRELRRNAIKYGLPDTPMTLSLRREQNRAVLEVDSRAAIGTTLSEDAFLGQRGVRSIEAEQSPIPGTGLGLTGVRYLMERMGGKARFERLDEIFRVSLEWPLQLEAGLASQPEATLSGAASPGAAEGVIRKLERLLYRA